MVNAAPRNDADYESHAGAPLNDPLYAALAGSPVMAARLDRALRYTWIYNPPAPFNEVRAIGRTDEEIYGAQAGPMMDLQRRVLQQGKAESGAFSLEVAGARRAFQLYVTPLLEPDGEVSGLSCLAISMAAGQAARPGEQGAHPEESLLTALSSDNARLSAEVQHELAERRRIERNLRESRHFLEQITRSSPLLIYIFDIVSGEVNYINRDLSSIYGPDVSLSQATNVLQLMQERIHPEDLARLPIDFSNLRDLPEGGVIVRDLRVRQTDGSWRWFNDRVIVFSRDERGAARQILGLTIDITERKLVEEELREATVRLARLNADLRGSRDLLRTLFDGIDDALALVDCHGQLLMLNQRMAALCDWAEEASQGGEMTWDGDICAPIGPLMRASLADGQARRERIRLDAPPGQPRTFDVQILPLLDEARMPDHLIIHVRDVSQQLQLEAQMVEHERFTAHGRLAATVAHEVSTPLQSIESCLHLAERTSDEAQRGRYMRLARDEIRRIGQIMRQLLDLYRPDSSRVGPVSLNALIERVLLLTGSMLNRQNITVRQSLELGLALVWGRADEITQVLINLIVNAIQAMPRGGVLRLHTRLDPEADPPAVIVEVGDTGAGIAPELLERIFEPFFTTRAEGSGLGLAVSQRIIASHNGQLRVLSSPGEGSLFLISLPALP